MFSKALFKSNLKRFFFLPVIHLVAMCFVPMMLYVRNMEMNLRGEAMRADYPVLREVVREMGRVFCSAPYLMIAALVVVVAVFSYLYSAKNSYMMHAFPLDRKTMFWTNIITAFLMIVVPTLLALIVSLPFASAAGTGAMGDLYTYYLYCLINTVFFIGVACFVAMCTGALIAVPVLYIILNFLAPGISLIVASVSSPFMFGVRMMGPSPRFSPVVNSESIISGLTYYHWEPDMKTGSFYSLFDAFGYEAAMLVAGILFLVAAYVIYMKKHVESVGSLLPMPWTRPVFRWGVAFCVAAVSAIFTVSVFFQRVSGYRILLVVYIIVFVVTGFISYFAVDMIINRSVRVFNKSALRQCGVMVACFIVVVLAIYADPLGVQKRVPDVSDIESANIYVNGTNDYVSEETGGEELSTILDIHKDIINNKRVIMDAADRYKYEWSNGCSMTFTYTLKNGKTLSRYYNLNYRWDMEPEIAAITDKIDAYINSGVALKRSIYGGDKEFVGERPRDIEIYLYNKDELKKLGIDIEKLAESHRYYDDSEKSVNITYSDENNVKKLMAAIEKDIEAGNLKSFITYNGVPYELGEEKTGPVDSELTDIGNIDLYFEKLIDGQYKGQNSRYLITKRCVNILNVIRES